MKIELMKQQKIVKTAAETFLPKSREDKYSERKA